MKTKPKKIGTAGETRVVNELKAAGLNAMRVVMKGTRDEGDVHILDVRGCVSAVLEIKSGKQTARPSRNQIAEWLDEAREEAHNVGNVRGYLVIARHRSSTRDYEVWGVDKHHGTRQFWYLDEFVDFVKGGF